MKTENGETVVYVNQYYEVNLTTTNATSYYYLGGKLIASSENGSLMYLHQDHLTSTSLMTDTSGVQIGSTVKYLPFGEARAAIDIPTDKLFTGQRLDDTGLYFYNARYYEPTIGRFISPDTIIPDFTNPQSLNRYSYCVNNPLKYTDPSGHKILLDADEDRMGEPPPPPPPDDKITRTDSTTYDITTPYIVIGAWPIFTEGQEPDDLEQLATLPGGWSTFFFVLYSTNYVLSSLNLEDYQRDYIAREIIKIKATTTFYPGQNGGRVSCELSILSNGTSFYYNEAVLSNTQFSNFSFSVTSDMMDNTGRNIDMGSAITTQNSIYLSWNTTFSGSLSNIGDLSNLAVNISIDIDPFMTQSLPTNTMISPWRIRVNLLTGEVTYK